jgi:hypothetical protein
MFEGKCGRERRGEIWKRKRKLKRFQYLLLA